MPIDPTIFLRGYRGAPDFVSPFTEANDRQRRNKMIDLQTQGEQLRLSEAQKGIQQKDQIENAARGAFTTPAPVSNTQPPISVGGVNIPGQTSTVQGPAQFDQSKFLNSYRGIDPLGAMGYEQGIAKQQEAQRAQDAETQYHVAQTQELLSKVPKNQQDTIATALENSAKVMLPMLTVPEEQKQAVWQGQVLPQLAQMGKWTPDVVQQHAQYPGDGSIKAQIAGSKAGLEYIGQQRQASADQLNQDKFSETKRHNLVMESKPTPGVSTTDAGAIADAIVSGDQPPTLKGLYRNAAPVRAELAKRGFNLSRAETDWNAVQKHVATLNGNQQTRLQQAVSTASDSLDKIEGLYNEWKQLGPNSGVKVFNRAALAASKNLPGRTGAVAQALEAQIADLTAELGVVYMGGNSPTDHALSLAKQNLSADWNDQTFTEGLKQARSNIAIRRNSILNTQPVGVSSGSPYVAPQQAQSGPKVGEVDGGYKFNGGDPADPKNWTKQ